MTKTEKRRIRLQAIQILDQHCQRCEYHSKLNSCMSVCRECPHGQRMQEISRPLWEENDFDPYFLSHRVGRWSRDEDFYLVNHYDVHPVEVLAARLGRTTEAIRKRIAELKGGEPA
ncbi:hypothetical protein MKY25_01545 [Geobacillus sp. FSL W8-0032]|uniref:Zinc-finger domain-containing protein n=1 Tax=Geobacillus icigianus TaxID=1430331 RepID=A0ABU6BLG8_9BACL|nr:hypothetical protein [Geobacillus icigianus]MEB3752518.1 hypothetical protein [Geobacillus icigianus]